MLKRLSGLAIKFGIIPFFYYLIRAYFLLVRIRVVHEDWLVDHLNGGGRAIFAVWHQRIFLFMSYAKRIGVFSPSVMISQSRDGEMIASIMSRLNIRPVRGSSSRGGRKALAAMVADIAYHQLAAHVVDGPQGPRGVVKEGLITMAQLSGAAIFPLYASVSRAWVLKSWDHFLIPKPFSRILFRWDRPLYIAENLDAQQFETMRLQVEQQMRQNQDADDCLLGWAEGLLQADFEL
ncbi:MAG: lysophospholipid acyltransferase family protein [Syntrophales bacterium]|nr:lysophospholipid acyltransferase family protein [Syntrophales bacterium]